VRTPTSWPSLLASTDSLFEANGLFQRLDLGQTAVDGDESFAKPLGYRAACVFVVLFGLRALATASRTRDDSEPPL